MAVSLAGTNALAQAHSTASGPVVVATHSVPATATLGDHPRQTPADEGLRRPSAPGQADNSAPAGTDDIRETALLGAALTALVWLHRRNRKGPGKG